MTAMQNEQTPAAGPLTAESVALLKKGDLLMTESGAICTVITANPNSFRTERGLNSKGFAPAFTFLGRPDQDGWIAWHGGGNPVPGVRVDVWTVGTGMWADWLSDQWSTSWLHEDDGDEASHITHYRPHVASTASSSSVVQGDANGVEPAHVKVGAAYWRGEVTADQVASTIQDQAAKQTSRPQPSGETRDCPHGLHSVGSCSDCSVNRSMDDQPHAPVSRPAGEGERESVAILKGVGKITGDGWKDTTTKGDVVFVWSAERPSPYAPGQYPRIGNEGWSASTSQYDFTPATADDVPAILSLLSPAAPDTGGGERPHGYLVKDFADGWYWTPNAALECTDGALVWSIADDRYETEPPALQPGGER